ncbi:hypothetical protein ACFFRL_00140 [Agromyces hippuratus]|uniref:hypothetical protein n=1 Tax=Agromyces hippuratus TaxID=286438 RepID=UPI0035EDF2D9
MARSTQLMLSALVVPAFAKLGDMVGHKRMLVWSTAVTAVASIALAFTDQFWVFLVAWALQVLRRLCCLSRSPSSGRAAARPTAGGDDPQGGGPARRGPRARRDRRCALGGRPRRTAPMQVLLLVPAVAVVACLFVVLFGVKESPDLTGGTLDTGGLILISLALLSLTAGSASCA